MRYRFGNFLLDTLALELRRGGEVVHLPARTLALLVNLVENRHRVVSRDELTEVGWPGRYIAEHTLTGRISELRAALRGAGEEDPIRTVYGQGIRFAGAATPVGQVAVPREGGADEETPPTGGRPSVAVLPFRMIDATGPRAVLAEALPDEIITALSKLRWLFVIARGSSFQFPSHAFPPGEVGARLQARYCVAGMIEPLGGRLAITVELSDTDDAQVVWRERYEEDVRGIHAVREAIAERVACEVNHHIPAHEIARARMLAPDSLDAWQAYHRGLGLVMGADLDRYPEARTLFRRAIHADPGFARAHAGYANTLFLETLFRQDDAAAAGARAVEAAERAFALDPRDPYCGLMRARMKLSAESYDSGIAALREVIKLAPSNSIAHSDLARVEVIGGNVPAARRAIETALRLNPLDPYNHTSFSTLALIELAEGNFAEAAQVARESKQLSFLSLDDRLVALTSFHFGEDRAAAEREAQAIRREFPGMTFERYMGPVPALTAEQQEMLHTVFAEYRL